MDKIGLGFDIVKGERRPHVAYNLGEEMYMWKKEGITNVDWEVPSNIQVVRRGGIPIIIIYTW